MAPLDGTLMTTNLRTLGGSRRKPVAGDLFVMLPPDDRYLFGRVVSTEARVGPMSAVILIYIYRVRSLTKDPPKRPDLRPDCLLVPPIMTNARPWREGVFETIDNIPLNEGETLRQHCFRRYNGDYLDETSNLLSGPTDPVGDYGLHSFRTIDDAVSDALGIERVPEGE